MNNPLVSIIIPTYNRPKYLQRAIHSVLNQSYRNIEVIIIDDNSMTNLLPTIKAFKDNRIRYYRNKENKGPTFSRNKGIILSKGSYINFLDDDDELLPKKIEIQLNKFQTSRIKNLGVVVCDIEYKRVDISGIKRNHIRGNILKNLFKSYCIYGTCSMLIKTEFIVKFDINLSSNQEYDLALRLAKRCNFDFVPKCLAIQHTSDNQISYNYIKKINGTKSLFQKYRREFLNFGINSYIYNWFRFKFLLLKYYYYLQLGQKEEKGGIFNILHQLFSKFAQIKSNKKLKD